MDLPMDRAETSDNGKTRAGTDRYRELVIVERLAT
jgi:hypothetical protein